MKNRVWFAGLVVTAASLVCAPPRVMASVADTSAPAAAGSLGARLTSAGTSDRAGLNFRSAPLNEVLEYLSANLGYIINKEADGPTMVELGGNVLADREQALETVNAALKKSGYALIRQGRILTLTSFNRMGAAELDLLVGSDPRAVEKSAEVVNQVIPVRYARASELANNLRALLPREVLLSVNEAANALLLMASKTDIRRALEIIAVLDSAVANVSTVKVIRLHYAEAKQVATVVQQMFGAEVASTGGAQALSSGPGGGPGGDFGPPVAPGADPGGQAASGTAARGRATATADEPANALIVSAPESLLATISSVVAQLDRPVTETTELRIFPLRHADPTELASQLAEVFPDPAQSGSGQDQAASRFGGMPAPPEIQEMEAAAAAASGGSTLKKDRVVATPDPRTSSLLVSAPSSRMPLVSRLIQELDSVDARKEVVKTWDLRNAGPQDVNQALQDLFNRTSASRSGAANNRSSLLGDNHPLTVRATRQQSTTTSSGSKGGGSAGTSGSGGGGGGPGGGGS